MSDSYKEITVKFMKDLCCVRCGKLDKNICNLSEMGSRICSKCPSPSVDEQKVEDGYARKQTLKLLSKFGDLQKAQEYIKKCSAEVDTTGKTAVCDDGDDDDDDLEVWNDGHDDDAGDDDDSDIGARYNPQDEGTSGITPDEYRMYQECQQAAKDKQAKLTLKQHALQENQAKDTLFRNRVAQKEQLKKKLMAQIEELINIL